MTTWKWKKYKIWNKVLSQVAVINVDKTFNCPHGTGGLFLVYLIGGVLFVYDMKLGQGFTNNIKQWRFGFNTLVDSTHTEGRSTSFVPF